MVAVLAPLQIAAAAPPQIVVAGPPQIAILALPTTPTLQIAAAALWLVLWVTAMVRVEVVAARMYQIEEYEAARLWAWANARAWNWHRAVIAALVAGALAGALAVVTGAVAWITAEGLVTGVVFHVLWRWTPPKKALVWTSRMKRLFATTVALTVLLGAGAALVVAGETGPWPEFVIWVGFALGTTIPVAVLIVANAVLKPAEARVRRGYLVRARARLAAVDPTVIAVAGSWGKTSTKHILARLLPDDAHALPTPKSFNTLMGVTRTINENLEDAHRTFVVEMDAYAPGEIAAMCDLVHPRLAVITAVGAQHLERFGTVERIGAALYEAVAALPKDGTAVIYAGDPRCAALATRAREEGRAVVTYALESEAAEADVIAAGVSADPEGSRFTWRWPANKQEVAVRVPLLGSHQVLNVSAALAAVHLLGHDVAAAAERAGTLVPVEHRLQPVPSGNGVTVIDDSYNANPVGVHNGLDVLAGLGDGQKILVTPGMVELGSEEAAENRRYGEHAARVCDHVIVMRAKTSDALLAGLREGGIADDAIHVVESLDEATAVIGRVARRGDVVLFANDLPDTYL